MEFTRSKYLPFSRVFTDVSEVLTSSVTSKTSVNFYQTSQPTILDDSHLHYFNCIFKNLHILEMEPG
jgi:hypothetical protein